MIIDNGNKENIGIRVLSSNTLKVIACVSMLIDHIGLVFMDNNQIMRAAGRLAFPVFAFLIVQGLMHTSNIRRYILRLCVFAVVSEIPFDLAFYDRLWYPGAQNVFFTLALGLFAIYAFETDGTFRKWAVEIAFISALAAEFLRFDYGMAGIGVIFLFYLCEKQQRKELGAGEMRSAHPEMGAEKKISETASAVQGEKVLYFGRRQNIELVVVSAVMYILCLGMSQLYALLALVPINMYNGRRGRYNLKYLFYLFYPLHLLLLWIILCKISH